MGDFVEVRKYIQAVFRWWWLIILLSAGGGLIGFEFSKRLPPTYLATTTIIVGQSMNTPDLTKTDLQTSELLALTYADLARRQPLLKEVIKALNLNESERALRKRVTIEQVSGTQLLELKVEAGSLPEAQAIADELARQLILLSPSGLQNEIGAEKQQFIEQRLESLQTKIEKGQQRLTGLEVRLNNTLPIAQLQDLQREINDLEGLIFDWGESYTQLLIFAESQKSPNHLTVVEPAQGSSVPIRPNPELHSLLAGAVAFLLALGFIIAREYLDNTLKSKEDFNDYLEMTLLGTIQRIDGQDFQDKLVLNQSLFSPLAEAYRMVRSNLQFMSIDRPAQAILVTSAIPGEGKSTTTANLAVVMAQNELKTVIVDSDLRRPTQHMLFDIPNSIGVTDFLRAPESNLEDYLKKTRVKNLYVLTSGASPPNPSELLGSERMAQLVTRLNEFADVVIYDSPPLAAFTDATVLSTKIDGVVLVTRAGRTHLDLIRQAQRNLEQVGGRLLGGVLNGLARKEKEIYYRAYYSSETLEARQPTTWLAHYFGLRRWRQWLPFDK